MILQFFLVLLLIYILVCKKYQIYNEIRQYYSKKYHNKGWYNKSFKTTRLITVKYDVSNVMCL